jgi:hypothetical protein
VPLLGSAQAPYTGGKGDGFAMTEANNVTVGLKPENHSSAIKVHPNPIPKGTPLKVAHPHEQNLTIISIETMQGNQVQAISKSESGPSTTLSTHHISQGIYLLRLEYHDRVAIRKIVIH